MKRGRKPVYARFRIETLERHIALQIVREQDAGVAALRRFAKEIGVRPDEAQIKVHTQMYIDEIERWRKQS